MAITTRISPYQAFATQNPTRVRKTASTPQSQPIPGENQVKNNAGGYVYQADAWKVLDRFLILGTEGGTYYTSQEKLTKENAKNVLDLIAKDGQRVVARVVEISEGGRAPKNSPALFALALCISYGDAATKRAAATALPRVARIGTHLFEFVEYATHMRGWGRVLREAVSTWYLRYENDYARNNATKDTVSDSGE